MTEEAGWDYPRETEEYVFFDELLVNGVEPAASIVEYALTRGLARPQPGDWAAVVDQAGRKSFLLDGTLDPGKYKVWVRVIDSPEKSVIEAGYINIT